jgi:hypothetical protein
MTSHSGYNDEYENFDEDTIKTKSKKMHRDVDVYMDTVNRFEPDIHPTDIAAHGTSIAISLKRIADILEANYNKPTLTKSFWSRFFK